jgi:hypothetical protein
MLLCRYLFGAPASGRSSLWNDAATVVADKIVNFRSTNDWFMKLMLRGARVCFLVCYRLRVCVCVCVCVCVSV